MLNTKWIRLLRKELGLTQEQAAQRAGLKGKARWADIETGKRANITLSTLEAIAKALDVSPAHLVGTKGHRPHTDYRNYSARFFLRPEKNGEPEMMEVEDYSLTEMEAALWIAELRRRFPPPRHIVEWWMMLNDGE